jgi:uncharacterized protein
MSYDYAGKVAIITGASAGIGESLAKRLAARGVKVALAARRADRLAAVKEAIENAGGEAYDVVCDVTLEEDNHRLVQETFDRWGRLDLLVLNAGRGNTTSIEDTAAATLESIFQLNVFALYYATRAALPVMKKQGSGHIITVASMAGKLGLPYMNAYVAAKHAAVGFSNALRLELLETGIEATVVCPAAVATEWAVATEGAAMGELYMRSMQRAREIAKERGIKGRGGGGEILTADDVADHILGAIEHPVPEVYTHRDTQEAAAEAAADRMIAERRATPMALAMREVYPSLTRKPGRER